MRVLLLVWAAMIVVIAPRDAMADRQKLVVVVAKGSKLTSISRSDLRRCFLGEPIVVNEKPLVPFNSEPSSASRTAFDQGVLGMSASEVGRFWVDRKIRGQSGAPRSLPTLGHVVKVVAKFPNAVSYVPADQVTAALQPVAIDGVPYTDARYTMETR